MSFCRVTMDGYIRVSKTFRKSRKYVVKPKELHDEGAPSLPRQCDLFAKTTAQWSRINLQHLLRIDQQESPQFRGIPPIPSLKILLFCQLCKPAWIASQNS